MILEPRIDNQPDNNIMNWIDDALYPVMVGRMDLFLEPTADFVYSTVVLCVEFPDKPYLNSVFNFTRDEISDPSQREILKQVWNHFRYRPTDPVPTNIVLGEN